MDVVSVNRGSPSRVVRRAFWCPLAQREVEVEFRRPEGVVRCTAFDPPEAVACARRCTEAAYRRQWEYALPVR